MRSRPAKEGRTTVPTGVAIRDPRGQLFDAAERVLLRDGPGRLTSRAVTAEAGVAKGVLHRHFADFDAFLAELALDRVARTGAQAAALRATAGSGTVAGNLAAALPDLFSPAVLGLIRLVIARDELRTRLRAATGSRIPIISESTAMVAGYLAARPDLRLPPRPGRPGVRPLAGPRRRRSRRRVNRRGLRRAHPHRVQHVPLAARADAGRGRLGDRDRGVRRAAIRCLHLHQGLGHPGSQRRGRRQQDGARPVEPGGRRTLGPAP
jgi:AcrR family transcriptional regulator